ncbi:hypothetical protein HHL26_08880 [Sphingobium sp. TB-6]|uniref:TIR domain-containing protein n=1 Tax=Sphingobium sp. TB-6 TaxID=2728850 RepID=UPI00146ED04E|nr:TIR domain-containing protein [Sphingobium sp. TB-6]NML89177.1 hypothetical protein [Sphingobium sp. TB-6]
MAYRNGTYVAFHANGTNIPGGNSDIDYYNLLKAWSSKTDDDFTMCNSHEKTAAVRDTSSSERLMEVLRDRLKNSKNMILIIGTTTKLDDDWVPFEISQAVDKFKIPIIATYTNISTPIKNPSVYKARWPAALATRINNETASVIHIPYKKTVLLDAIGQFSHNKLPKGKGLGFYNDDAYRSFGIVG